MIESKVVEATEDFSKSLGINWGALGTPTTLGGSGSSGPLTLTPSFSIRPRDGGLLMNLNVGTLDFLGDLDAALSLAETNSVARIISAPRIVTMNREPSLISQSGEVISINTSFSGLVSNQGGAQSTKTVQRTPVTLSLNVTPQITAAGGVIMDVSVKRQFPGAVEDQETLARAINSREAKTKVLVHHGQTAVIGGIYNTSETDSDAGVPALKDIPVLGWLFKSTFRERRKNELLIFLTPTIMKQKI